MIIPQEQAEKLKRYLINADPFLWGVLVAKNKKGRLKELKQLGFLATYSEGANPIYTKINKDLLVELGITGILEKIVVPRIQNGFKQEILRYFRDCWEQGQTPDLNYLVKNKLYHKQTIITVTTEEVYDGWGVNPPVVGHKDPAFIFVQIDRQNNFVERWTVFAGLWFEEIEPLLH
ncbi:MAG: hypothetical protein ABSF21_07350 [Dehalococcoidia bacterium]|jgi:hypothetical protein